jgi:transcriptional regulator with XRE-family HTH domain
VVLCWTVEDSERQSIGAVIRTLREHQALSRQELVERTATDPVDRVGIEMLAKVEQGKKAPSAKTLRKIAIGLGIDPQELNSRALGWQEAAAVGATSTALKQLALGTGAGANFGSMVGLTLGAVASTTLLPGAGALVGAAALREMRQRGRWAALLEAKLAELVATGSESELQDAFATLERIRPSAETTPD